MQATQCPTRAELAEYLLGTAPESRLSELANHIDTCADCATTVERLENKKDSFLQALRGLAQEGELGEDPALQRAIDGAKQVACEAAQGRPNATTAVFVDAPGPDPAAAPLPEVAGYKLVAELGHGGMGTVYKAIQPHLERHVAIKLVKKDLTKESQAVSRFQREMKAVGLLDHVNIVRALHAGQEADQHFLVMEMVDGLSLSQLVQRVGPLPTADACELIRQAALGLQHAFEHGLVHRDVKPSNLMLDRRGQVKVLDLGLARLHPALVPGEEATSAGQLMGTADYMAPEQASDSHQVDIRADIYSLGCTLFELLVGRAPFRGPRYPNIMAKILAHSQQPVPDIRGERGDIPEALFQVLQRMLAKDAKERYTVPSEVATALEPLVIGCDLPGLLQRAHQVTASHAPADPSLDSTDAVAKSRSGTDAGRQTGTARLPWSQRPRPKQLFIALGLLPLLVLAGVVIWINKTRIEVPDGSDVRVNPDGSVAVNTPHGNVARAPSGTAGRSDADERPLVLRPPTSPSLAIPPEPIDLPAGAPLSPLALVQRPAAIPGVQSWTIETRGHRGGVTVLAASPDGQWVASGSTDGSVRLWDPGRKKLARVLLGHPFEIRAFAWSPDSRILASTCGGIVRFWDVASGRVLRTMTGGGL
ncbi:MAG: serine/threonine-protein kinase, partial [Pirellulaceae bacterium]|nr:serine/threonine-protein kinase [Pirellulaceae bacterium]